MKINISLNNNLKNGAILKIFFKFYKLCPIMNYIVGYICIYKMRQ